MFTTILTNDDSIKIKTGQDSCGVYRLGDTFEWNPSYWTPGESPDGVHEGWSEKDGGETVWVIIKESKIHAVIPKSRAPYEDAKLHQLYCIKHPPDSLWTEEQWAKYGRNSAMLKRLKGNRAECYGLIPGDADRASAVSGASAYTRSFLRRSSIMHSILPPKPVTPPVS